MLCSAPEAYRRLGPGQPNPSILWAPWRKESHVLYFYVHCTLLRGGTLKIFVNHVNSLICFQFHTLGWMTISREGEWNPESSIRGSWEFLLCSNILRSQSCKNGSLSFPTCSFVWNNHHKDPASVQELREAPSIYWRGGAKEARPCLVAVPGPRLLRNLEPSVPHHKSFSEQIGLASWSTGPGGSSALRCAVGSGDRRTRKLPAPN